MNCFLKITNNSCRFLFLAVLIADNLEYKTKLSFQYFFKSWVFAICFPFAISANEINPIYQLQQDYQKATFISANFHQNKQVKFISQPLVSEGSFQFADGQGLNWQIDKPFAARTLFLPTGVFKVTEAGGVVKEKDIATRAIADLLKSLFSGHWENLTQKFSLGKTKLLNDDYWEVSLVASDKWVKKAVKSIRLKGRLPKQGKSNTSIKEIRLLDAKGNMTTMFFTDLVQHTLPLSDMQKKLFIITENKK